jgi:hypothetical protein
MGLLAEVSRLGMIRGHRRDFIEPRQALGRPAGSEQLARLRQEPRQPPRLGFRGVPCGLASPLELSPSLGE